MKRAAVKAAAMKGAAIALGCAALLAGCGSSTMPPSLKGVVWLSWTVAGQAASDSACAGVDHLVITIESSPSVGVAIEPVPCTHGGGWERDDVPEGSDTVLVDAVDAGGATILERIATVGVTESRPAAPTPVDLQPL